LNFSHPYLHRVRKVYQEFNEDTGCHEVIVLTDVTQDSLATMIEQRDTDKFTAKEVVEFAYQMTLGIHYPSFP
jgi:hypothetical protein